MSLVEEEVACWKGRKYVSQMAEIAYMKQNDQTLLSTLYNSQSTIRMIAPRAPMTMSTGIGSLRPTSQKTIISSAMPPMSKSRPFSSHPYTAKVNGRDIVCSSGTYSRDLSSTPRLIQHKNEAKAFYAFLSQVYDYIVNPGAML